jgi:hypothetical protein
VAEDCSTRSARTNNSLVVALVMMGWRFGGLIGSLTLRSLWSINCFLEGVPPFVSNLFVLCLLCCVFLSSEGGRVGFVRKLIPRVPEIHVSVLVRRCGLGIGGPNWSFPWVFSVGNCVFSVCLFVCVFFAVC